MWLSSGSSLRCAYCSSTSGGGGLGKLIRAKGPGLVVLLPFGVDRLKRIDLHTVALDVPP